MLWKHIDKTIAWTLEEFACESIPVVVLQQIDMEAAGRLKIMLGLNLPVLNEVKEHNQKKKAKTSQHAYNG